MNNEQVPLLSLSSLCFSVVDEQASIAIQAISWCQLFVPGRTWLRACLSTLKDTWSKKNGCIIWLERLRRWLVILSSFQNIFLHRQWVLQSPFQNDQAVWCHCDRLKWSTFGFTMGWFSPYPLIMLDLTATVSEVGKSLLACINSCPLHIHAWQSHSHLWAVCACTLRWAGLLGFVLPFPRCICMLGKTGRNKCCRLFYKNVSASTLMQ